jgi:AhpD family alkylhydroperoxidase
VEHHHKVIDDLREPTRSLRAAIPDAWAGFSSLHREAMADGAVPTRLKEVTALVLSVVKHCDGCIAYHAKAAARAGATPAEVAELLGVALLMDGGTASVYAPRAWAAYNEFAETSGSVTPVARTGT